MVAGIDPWLSALLAVAFGVLLGLVNGLIAGRFRILVIVVTLQHGPGEGARSR